MKGIFIDGITFRLDYITSVRVLGRKKNSWIEVNINTIDGKTTLVNTNEDIIKQLSDYFGVTIPIFAHLERK